MPALPPTWGSGTFIGVLNMSTLKGDPSFELSGALRRSEAAHQGARAGDVHMGRTHATLGQQSGVTTLLANSKVIERPGGRIRVQFHGI